MALTYGFIKGSKTERIYKFIVSRRATTSKEILEYYSDVKKSEISTYLRNLHQMVTYLKALKEYNQKWVCYRRAFKRRDKEEKHHHQKRNL